MVRNIVFDEKLNASRNVFLLIRCEARGSGEMSTNRELMTLAGQLKEV